MKKLLIVFGAIFLAYLPVIHAGESDVVKVISVYSALKNLVLGAGLEIIGYAVVAVSRLFRL